MSRLITERAAARYMGLTREALRDLRERGVVAAAGYVRVRTALYDTATLDEFLLTDALVREGYARVIVVFNEELTLIDEEECT